VVETSQVQRTELRVPVGGSPGLEGLPAQLEIAVTVIAPATTPADRPVVLCCFPGGGYSRGYWDIPEPGYSEAAWHAERGWIVVAVDHLGVGESSLADWTDPHLLTLSFEQMAAGNAATVRHVLARLADGDLVPGLGSLHDPVVLGAGQSMGGCITTVQQARHRTFAGVAVLGWSGLHTTLPSPPGTEAPVITTHARGDVPGAGALDTIQSTSTTVGDGFRWAFHWGPDEPLVRADLAGGYPLRQPPAPAWGSVTTPPCAASMLLEGVVAAEAAAIDVPVFIGDGERDVCPDPHAEPSAYPSSRDVEVHVTPRMAHMHNFAETRVELWERLQHWGTGIAGRAT
jgi:alpha-beta hydrolase superfamily lysophospholipase